MERITIVGGGLVGCLASIFLTWRGFRVSIYERHADPRLQEVSRRPSINLTLCERGLRSLKSANVMDYIQPLLMPAYGRLIHLKKGGAPGNGKPVYQPYGDPTNAIYSVNRNDLNTALLRAAEAAGVNIQFGFKCTGVDARSGTIWFGTEDGSDRQVDGSCIVAADGASSAVRYFLQRSDRFEYSQQFSTFGYKELKIPPRSGSQPSLETGALHLWPRDSYMAIAFPNTDGSHSCSVHLPFSGPNSFESLRDPALLYAFFAGDFPDLLPLIPDLASRFNSQRPNSMVTVRCFPWSFGGKILLIGDAAHSILPYYGQGANAGFEDCALLDQLIARFGPDWKSVFSAFELTRKPDLDAIADLCYIHAQELHNLAASAAFQLRRRIERRLHQVLANDFVPLYSMIAFSSMSYAAARSRGRLQERIIDDLMTDPAIERRLEDREFVNLIRARLGNDLPAAAGPMKEAYDECERVRL